MTAALQPATGPGETTGDSAPLRSEEVELIRAAQAGNHEAFAELVRSHHRRVYNFVYQMTRHRHDAEDLTQQTFIRAHGHLARFDPMRPFINWLLTIARHATLNHFRDTKKWTDLPFDPASSEPSPAHRADIRDRTENLWDRARAVLSPREFQVLWLRFAEELSTEETARVAGLTTTHVKVLVYRARQTLMKGES